MWHKTLTVKFKGQKVDVVVYFSGETTGEKEKCKVKIRSMLNEYFLLEKVYLEDRDCAYNFIKNYSQSMALAFVTKTAYEVDAVDFN